jgi:interferon gamma-inducible protein 30
MLNFIFLALTLNSLVFTQYKIPKIELYVESLCPYCINLLGGPITELFQYNHPNLAVVDIIPYGNAKEVWNETTQRWDFTCQHAENECYGNLIETCAINLLGRVKSYEVILCIEENIKTFNLDFDETLKNCVSDKRVLDEIMNCVQSDIGNKYQHEMALKTGAHLGVPWIVIDGIHDDAVDELVFEDIIGYLCSLPHADCNDDYRFKSRVLPFEKKILKEEKCEIYE